MCYLQPLPGTMKPPEKKTRKAKYKTGEEVVEAALNTYPRTEKAEPLTKEWTAPHYTTGDNFTLQRYMDPEAKNKTAEEVVQAVLNTDPRTEKAEPLIEEWTAPHYTTGDNCTLQRYMDPERQRMVNKQLPSYEEMQQSCQDLFNGPSSMETQPDLPPVHIMEEGVAVLPEGQQLEWWPIEGEFDVPNLEELALQEYLMEASKPLHTNFVLPDQGKALGYTCPVYFGNADSKQKGLDAICNSIYPKIYEQWGTFSCHCGLVPRLKLSQTSRNPNKVFLSCPKERETQCHYFQWIHQAPKPVKVTKAATPSALRKRMHDMVEAKLHLEKQPKVQEGGFKFP